MLFFKILGSIYIFIKLIFLKKFFGYNEFFVKKKIDLNFYSRFFLLGMDDFL